MLAKYGFIKFCHMPSYWALTLLLMIGDEMWEIGSEFWNIPTAGDNNIFPEETNWFISGRSALQAILQENNFKTAAVPFWCCDSMIVPFLNCNIRVIFYRESLPETDVARVMNYFGYVNSGINTDGYRGIIIRDLTHSIFSNRYKDADYYYGSLRKWAGFVTGGYAWGLKNMVEYDNTPSAYSDLRKRAMAMKAAYIDGETEKKDFLPLFSESEALLEDIRIIPADERDVSAARCLDVNFIIKQRRKNAMILLNEFKKIAIYPNLENNDCPLFVPIRVKNRDKLRQYLINHDIFCPVHWPTSKYHMLDKEDKVLYDEELSLICDQRYSETDMYRIINCIKEFYEGESSNA